MCSTNTKHWPATMAFLTTSTITLSSLASAAPQADSWWLGHVEPDDVVIADIGDQALDIFLHGPESAHKNGIFFLFFPDFLVCFCFVLFVLDGFFFPPAPPPPPRSPPCFRGRGGGGGGGVGSLFCFFNLGWMQTYDSIFTSPFFLPFFVYCLVCLL